MKPFLILLAAIIALAIALVFLPSSLSKEGGPIESLTLVLYLAAVTMILLRKARKPFYEKVLPSLIILALFCRELDFDKRFTEMGIFKSRFYPSPDVPLGEKLAAAVVTIFLAVTFILFVKHFARSFFKRPKTDPLFAGVVMAGLLALVSKLGLDGLPRRLASIGINLSEATSDKLGGAEEGLEIGIPLTLLLMLFLLRVQRPQRS